MNTLRKQNLTSNKAITLKGAFEYRKALQSIYDCISDFALQRIVLLTDFLYCLDT